MLLPLVSNSMGRNGYEPIPEAKAKIDVSLDSKMSPQERYPEANVEEAELLGLLDDVMEDPTVSVQLPILKESDVEITTTLSGFLCSMVLPTLVFLLSALLAMFVAVNAVPGLVAMFLPYFPYAVALLAFLSSMPPTSKRFQTQADQIEAFVAKTPPVAKDTVHDVVLSVASKIDLVIMRLNLVVDTMRPKFSEAHAAEKKLKAMDPNMSLPDPSAVERELEGAKDEIDESIKFVEKSFPVTPWIPSYLLSAKLYKRRASSRVFPFFLIILFAAAFTLTLYYPVKISASQSKDGEFFLDDLVQRVFGMFTIRSKDIKGNATTLSEDLSFLVGNAWPVPLVFVVVVYALAILQLTVVFRWTSASATAAVVNELHSSVSAKTNHLLRQQGILFLCQDILEIRMGRVKSRLLEMITQLYKIEMLMSLTSSDTSSPSPPKATSKSASPISPSGKRRISNLFGNKSE